MVAGEGCKRMRLSGILPRPKSASDFVGTGGGSSSAGIFGLHVQLHLLIPMQAWAIEQQRDLIDNIAAQVAVRLIDSQVLPIECPLEKLQFSSNGMLNC